MTEILLYEFVVGCHTCDWQAKCESVSRTAISSQVGLHALNHLIANPSHNVGVVIP